MNRTQIEWALNPDGSPGYTWNPITGCLNGCTYCYARRLANTRLKERYQANKNIAPVHAEGGDEYHKADKAIATIDPFYPRFWSDRCNRIGMVQGKSPKGIFVCDMSDLFGIGIPEDWTHRVLDRVKEMCLHRFYLLTKQPQNLIKFSPFPDNAWVGVSAEGGDQFKTSFYEARHQLLMIQVKVKFISFEPLLGEVADIVYQSPFPNDDEYGNFMEGINWVIIGQQTPIKKATIPKIEWVREIVEAADKAGIPVFLKNNLEGFLPPEVPTFYSLRLKGWHDDGEPEYEPVLRQEMPK